MRNLLILFICFASFSFSNAQTKVGSATLPDTENFKDHSLILNGAGIREKFWIDLYAAGLYVDEKSTDAKNVLSKNEPMAIKLHIVSKLISSEKLIDAVKEGFDKSTNGNTEAIQPQIDKMLGFFSDEISKDDVFDLVYFPSEGAVVAYKNGEERGAVKGEEFRKALFGIWLSDKAADGKLRKSLLGI